MITPRTTIIKGSIKDIRPESVASISSSKEVRDTFEHVIDVTGLFTGAHHADDHGRENRVLAQRVGNAFAAFDVAWRLL